MFNKNVFTQTDVVADLIKDINEADYKAKMEALKGNQHKIDKNKNNKVDADDFKILRGEKKVNEDQVEEATSVKIPTSTGTRVLGHRYGNAAKTHRDSMADPFAVVKGPGQKDIEDLEKKKVKKEEIDPKKVTTDTLAGVVKGKTANPFAPKKVMIDVAGNVKEEVELDEGTMTHITLGKKVKNDEGGHNQDVHYKGKKIGSIDSYKHRTGLRYGGKHDATGDMDAGSRSPEEAVDFVRSSHAEHLKSMKEDVEQLDELSPKTLKSYAKKSEPQAISSLAAAHDKVHQHIDKTGKAPSSEKQVMKIAGKEIMHAAKRTKGLERVQNRLAKEEAEQIDEKVISSELQTIQGNHVVNSQTHTHPDAKHGVSTDTLVHKGTISSKGGSNKKKFEIHNHPNHGLVFKTNHTDDEKQSIKKHLIYNKMAGKGTAMQEEVEELDERELSKGETAEKERIVKGMKKSLAGFKARYGDKAKSVMYATATKQAKKD